MAPTIMQQTVVRMDGFPGAPGYMTFYSDSGAGVKTAIDTFVNTVKTNFPPNVTCTVPSEGNLILDSDGSLAGSWSSGTTTTIVGTGTGGYSAPVGACISWTTGVVVGRRALRGRTFLVPITGAAFDTDGTIIPASLTAFRGAASALWVAAGLRIWHRPTTPGGTDGVSHPVNGSTVRDRAAVLRSRRP